MIKSEPLTVNEAYCVKCRGKMKLYGRTCAGVQRLCCKWCKFTCQTTRTGTIANRIEIRKRQKFIDAIPLFRAGYSTRYVRRTLKIHGETAIRYRRLAFPEGGLFCACGRKQGHSGWCEWRVSLSPARQAYYAKCAAQSAIRLANVRPRVEPILTTWPYTKSFDNDDYALLKMVNDLVPRTITEAVRADACQEILMDVISGSLSVDQIALAVPRYIKQAYKFAPTKFVVSLDAPSLYGRTLAETLEG